MTNAPGPNRLSAAVGIATYRRPDILLECLRHLLKQARMPEEVVIADASPDAGKTRERILQELPELPRVTRFAHLESPAGLTLQRNHILDHTHSDVILFPDDDTLMSPQYVDRIMAVYEADTDGKVGGVEGAVTEGGPIPGAPAPALEGRGRRALRWLRGLPEAAVRLVVHSVIDRFGVDYYPPSVMAPVHGVPESLKQMPVVPVRTLYGCVMSYRRPLACRYRFNESLKYYAYMEDFEISYRIGKDYAMLRCLEAPARHLRVQGGRLHPSLVHYLCLINVAYIGRTVMDWTPELRRHLEHYARRDAKLEMFHGCFRKTGFTHYRGAKAGLRQVLAILDAPAEEVARVYERAAQEGFEKKVF
jgi:GT2 family glycosyltransferase